MVRFVGWFILFVLVAFAGGKLVGASEFHGTVCRLDGDHHAGNCSPITGTITISPEICAPGFERACAERDHGAGGGYGGYGTGPGMEHHEPRVVPKPPGLTPHRHHIDYACARRSDGQLPAGCIYPTPEAIHLLPQIQD
jgi:hypothetical protein